MTKTKPHQQGRKTVEQRKRTLERKSDMPRQGDAEAEDRESIAMDGSARQSEFPVSRGGMNQESRHNKHRAD